MDLMDAIQTRRSIRKYKDEPVPKETINQLLTTATLAPSASNSQPWAFVVVQDTQLLKNYSDRAKALLLQSMDDKPDTQGYKALLANPDFNIFHNAGTLIIIYASFNSPFTAGDCCLAAQNLMLAAYAQGLGTCWIGFSRLLLDNADFKQELGIPLTYKAVAPIIIGYPEISPAAVSRNPPQVLAWR
jgi:nitroreductase